MVDLDLLVQALQARGYSVEYARAVPNNAGEYELAIDGTTMDLAAARELLAMDEDEDKAPS